MTGPVDWSAVLSGRPQQPQPLNGRTEAEQRELRQAYEAQMDAVDVHWRRKREEAARFAAEVAQRGLWFGSALRECPECRIEEARGRVIEKVDHSCWIEDKRLEQRLADQARMARAEANGDIRQGVFYNGQPQDPVAEELAQYSRDRLEAAQLRQQARHAANPPYRGLGGMGL